MKEGFLNLCIPFLLCQDPQAPPRRVVIVPSRFSMQSVRFAYPYFAICIPFLPDYMENWKLSNHNHRYRHYNVRRKLHRHHMCSILALPVLLVVSLRYFISRTMNLPRGPDREELNTFWLKNIFIILFCDCRYFYSLPYLLWRTNFPTLLRYEIF